MAVLLKPKLISYISLLCFIYSLPNLAKAQTQPIIFYGFLISDENAQPIQLASIEVNRNGSKSLSNRKGYFRILVLPSDTIQIRSVGFETLELPLNGIWQKGVDTLTIMLASTSYELKQVTIVASNSRRDSIARAAAEILKNDPLLNNYDRIINRPRGNGLMGVITEMYYDFSKAGQDMVKFEQFVQYYREQQIIDTKYNKEIAKRITRLEEYFMDEFIIYCRPDRKFLLTAPEYDIYKHISDCGHKFRAQYGIKD
jgi:hypothetical protein